MTDHTLPIASSKDVRVTVRRLLKPERSRALLGTFMLIVATGAGATATRLLGVVIDEANGSGDVDVINNVCMAVAGCFAIAGVFGYLGRRVLAGVAERAMAQLRQDAFAAVVRLRLDVIERVGTADPLSRLTGDVGVVSDAAHEIFPVAAVMCLTATLATVGLIVTSPLLALAAASGLPVMVWSLRRYMRRQRPLYLDYLNAQVGVARAIHESSDGGRTVRAFRRTGVWRQRLLDAVQHQWDTEWPMCTERSVLYPMTNMSQGIALTATLIVGMAAHDAGAMTLGTLSAGALFIIQAFGPVNLIFTFIDKLQNAHAGLLRVVGVVQTKHLQVSAPDAASLIRPADGRVELRGVRFSYTPGQEVLHGLDLTIEAGERVAVVGVSGAGKSTIAKLIAGVHAPTGGTITIGGVPVERLDQREHPTVALVTQESHVFSGSVLDNCRLADHSASRERVQQALVEVHAWEWVDLLPDGLDTAVGTDGHPLTLVQTQQLALARILLIGPEVVILDEATAGLGSDTARGIERSFGAVLEGRTVITIAHRLDVASSADRVIVVDHGSVDAGLHSELIERNASYANMWKHWNAVRG